MPSPAAESCVSADPFERGHPATPRKRRAAGGRARSRRVPRLLRVRPYGRFAPPAARRRVPPRALRGLLAASHGDFRVNRRQVNMTHLIGWSESKV